MDNREVVERLEKNLELLLSRYDKNVENGEIKNGVETIRLIKDTIKLREDISKSESQHLTIIEMEDGLETKYYTFRPSSEVEYVVSTNTKDNGDKQLLVYEKDLRIGEVSLKLAISKEVAKTFGRVLDRYNALN